MKISLGELQNLLCKKEFNPYIHIDNSDKVLIHLFEELGELVRAYRKYGINSIQFNEELGDCQILLLFFAISTYTDLENVTLDKIRKNINSERFKPTKEELDRIKPLFKGLGELFNVL